MRVVGFYAVANGKRHGYPGDRTGAVSSVARAAVQATSVFALRK